MIPLLEALDHIEIGVSNCWGCDDYTQRVLKIGKTYLCATCLRELAKELDRIDGR